jgi:transcriptional regulator with XRE-family HTH domain
MTKDDIIASLREIRKEKGLSQDALSMALGHAGNKGSYISQVERGAYSPSVAVVITWADALGYELVLRPKE